MQNNSNNRSPQANFDPQNFRVVELRVLSHLCLQRMRRPHQLQGECFRISCLETPQVPLLEWWKHMWRSLRGFSWKKREWCLSASFRLADSSIHCPTAPFHQLVLRREQILEQSPCQFRAVSRHQHPPPPQRLVTIRPDRKIVSPRGNQPPKVLRQPSGQSSVADGRTCSTAAQPDPQAMPARHTQGQLPVAQPLYPPQQQLLRIPARTEALVEES